MLKKTSYLFLIFNIIQGLAQERIKLMSYNLMHFPSTYAYDDASNTFIDRSPRLKAITDEFQPDILMVCELENQTGADTILSNVLNVGTNKYASPNFIYNQSTSYTRYNQFLYYNTDKLILENQSILTTNLRDINNYTFILNTTDAATNPIYIEVYVAHLKASQNASNEQKRLDMVNVFTANLASVPSNHHIVFAGDLNIYTSSEPAYQELLDTTNSIVLVDPINSPGSWHNNSTYQALATQSPITTNNQFSANYGANAAGSDGVTGGLDDRFDFILLDQNAMTDTNLHYVSGSYHAYGNNGTCFNTSINNTDCAGSLFSEALRDHLFNMSDHLPVVLELETNSTFLQVEDASEIAFLRGNIAVTSLEVKNNNYDKYLIYNSLGQIMNKNKFSNAIEIINIETLSSGVYYLKIDNHKPLKFIKID